ncbi:hypothetical protein OB905_05000 [Halobacteria archaeon AArc-dxtr1]|nr:hypothetical protein [Halobacteria archaeon AArc-dxtr1]
MNRRNLLKMGSSGALISVCGCLDQFGDVQGTDDNSNTNAGNGELNGNESKGEPSGELTEYGDSADPLAFETLRLGDCYLEQEVIPNGVCSENPTSLHRTETVGDFPAGSTELYGFILNSHEDAEQLDETALNDLGIEGGSQADTYERPSVFVDDTDFETNSLIVLQGGFSSSPGTVTVSSVGGLSKNEIYIGAETSQEGNDEPASLTTLIQVEQSTVVDGLRVRQAHELVETGEMHYAIYATEK